MKQSLLSFGRFVGLFVFLFTLTLQAEEPIMKGMAFGFKAKNGYYRSDEALEAVQKMASLNINYVSLIVSVMQDNFFSTRVFPDYEYTVDHAELELIIDAFHEAGVQVQLNPIIEIFDGSWRGDIGFPRMMNIFEGVNTDYWARWFDSYTACAVSYAKLAQRKDVALLSLGAEYDGTMAQEDHWQQLIKAVREHYDGALSYEMTSSYAENLEQIPEWIGELDYVGVNFYRSATDRKLTVTEVPSVEAMIRYLEPQVEKVRAIHERFNKPIIFPETGCRSRLGASQYPSDWKRPGPYSGEEQANYMEAVWRTFKDQSWWRGMFWWKWDEQQYRSQYHDDPAGEKGFTIEGKPAEQRMKRIYTE